MPEIVSAGPDLGEADLRAFEAPIPRGVNLDQATPLGVVTEHAGGFGGRPGIVGARPDGSAWSPRFAVDEMHLAGDHEVQFVLSDQIAGLGLELRFHLEHTLTMSATLTNRGDTTYTVQRLAPSLPLPSHAEDLLTFSGRWCREFQPQRSSFEGLTVVENRRGRTSHQRVPAIFAGSSGFSEQSGEVFGVQLAWSGNFEIAAEALPDGRRHVQAGELLSPGEVVLDPGDSYRAPDLVVAWSGQGLTGASQRFHQVVRSTATAGTERKVVCNTWEAVYFNHDLVTLQALADAAAAVGVERFVLDDGWFGGRRDDNAGLGDWWVSEAVWPTGLAPIIDHVTARGMDFGLWVEPEMVNPDSDLYRAHPEWTLTTAGYEPILGRHQLVLDLGRTEVRDLLFGALHELVDEYDIAYLKWDMNRDIVQGSHHGHAGAHGHVLGVYELIDRMRSAHPGLEIESCASGGGRADLGILRRTERIWTSDCNDAVERQSIQRGFSMLFPPEVMGAHIGPERAHTTRRRQDLGFRAATALFGHFGIEWNLLSASEADRAELASAVAVHKRLRPLLHRGRVVRVDHPDPAAIVHGVVSGDGSHAVFAYVQLTPSSSMVPLSCRLAGLDPDRTYHVTVIEGIDCLEPHGREQPAWIEQGTTATGAQLVHRGIQPPAMHPESVLLMELVAS